MSRPKAPLRLLLLIAHPDDESMFFVPLLRSLDTAFPCEFISKLIPDVSPLSSVIVHVLCMTTGDAEGLGEVRQKEMQSAVSILLRPRTEYYLHFVNRPTLPDSLTEVWNPEESHQIVMDFIQQNGIDVVFTFDEGGVSGHPNHISTYWAALLALGKLKMESKAPVYGFALQSMPLYMKYLSVLSIALDFLLNTFGERMSCTSTSIRVSFSSMWAHRSQFVWYRVLFLLFSSYAFVNVFRPLQQN